MEVPNVGSELPMRVTMTCFAALFVGMIVETGTLKTRFSACTTIASGVIPTPSQAHCRDDPGASQTTYRHKQSHRNETCPAYKKRQTHPPQPQPTARHAHEPDPEQERHEPTPPSPQDLTYTSRNHHPRKRLPSGR